jgi:hypothetical protein
MGSPNTTPLDLWPTPLAVDPQSKNYISRLVDNLTVNDYGSGRQPFMDVAIWACAVIIWVTEETDPKWSFVRRYPGYAYDYNGWWQHLLQGVQAPETLGNDGCDNQAVIWDRKANAYYEMGGMTWDSTLNTWNFNNASVMYNVSQSDAIWTEMTIWPGTTSWTSPYGGWGGVSVGRGVTGSQIPYLGYTPTIEEMLAGEIPHMIGLVLPNIKKDYYTGPIARHTDGGGTDPFDMPEGAILRLPADFDVDAYRDRDGNPLKKFPKMIARAVKTYGFIVNDNGGSGVIRVQNPGGLDTGMTFTTPYTPDPYLKDGGIFDCVGVDHYKNSTTGYPGKPYTWDPDCNGQYTMMHFPWHLLQLMKLDLKHN